MSAPATVSMFQALLARFVADRVQHRARCPRTSANGASPKSDRDFTKGTLYSAIGPVAGRFGGNQLLLEFEVKGSFKLRREPTLSPDGRRSRNVKRAHQLGVTLAVFVDKIHRP